jgi:hypothetical protein
VIFTVVSSVFVQRFLYLAPLAIVGNVLGCVGSALMTTFTTHTAAGKWIVYQLLVGSGRGLGLTVPFLAVQAYTPKAQLSVATAVVAFSQFFGGALFIAFGQTAFANLLRQSLTRFAPDVNQEVVVEAGATNYAADVPADQQPNVLRAYNRAIVQTFYLAVAAASVGVFTAAALGAAKTEQKIKKKNADADAEKVESNSWERMS